MNELDLEKKLSPFYPDMMKAIDQNVAAIATLRYMEEANPFYDILGDMILWEDEFPIGPPELTNCFRIILHLRTRWALTDDKSGEMLWAHLKTCVPTWPGFRAERCDRVRLRALYEELKVPVQLPPE